MNDVGTALRDWLSVEGRIGRKDYLLRYMLPTSFAMLITLLWKMENPEPDTGSALLGLLVNIATLYLTVAGGIKRWHDRGKSGWWCLIGFVPVLGTLWTMVELGFLRGTPGPNNYGPDPLANMRRGNTHLPKRQMG